MNALVGDLEKKSIWHKRRLKRLLTLADCYNLNIYLRRSKSITKNDVSPKSNICEVNQGNHISELKFCFFLAALI